MSAAVQTRQSPALVANTYAGARSPQRSPRSALEVEVRRSKLDASRDRARQSGKKENSRSNDSPASQRQQELAEVRKERDLFRAKCHVQILLDLSRLLVIKTRLTIPVGSRSQEPGTWENVIGELRANGVEANPQHFRRLANLYEQWWDSAFGCSGENIIQSLFQDMALNVPEYAEYTLPKYRMTTEDYREQSEKRSSGGRLRPRTRSESGRGSATAGSMPQILFEKPSPQRRGGVPVSRSQTERGSTQGGRHISVDSLEEEDESETPLSEEQEENTHGATLGAVSGKRLAQEIQRQRQQSNETKDNTRQSADSGFVKRKSSLLKGLLKKVGKAKGSSKNRSSNSSK
eukprot:Clim_evm63s214 gene=Clim_evmTU63s214